MEVRLEKANGAPLASVPEMLAGIAQKLQQEQHIWRQRLQADPRQFGEVEALSIISSSPNRWRGGEREQPKFRIPPGIWNSGR